MSCLNTLICNNDNCYLRGALCNALRVLCERDLSFVLSSLLEISFLLAVMKALQCPFLNRLPVTQVKSCAPQLLRMADRCPIIGHVMRYTSAISGPGEQGKRIVHYLSEVVHVKSRTSPLVLCGQLTIPRARPSLPALSQWIATA